MSNGALYGIAALVIYGVVLAFIIRAGIRWSRRTAQTRANVLKAGIETAGGKALVERPVTKLYEVTESEYELDGQRLFVSSSFVSRSWIRLNLRVPTVVLPSWVVFPEGGVQKFGKVLGPNREVQTGDQAFDDAAYIDCHDDAAQVAKLLSVHRLYLPALVDGAPQSSVDTNCKVLSTLKVGDPVTIRVHDGALGMQWVELVPSS